MLDALADPKLNYAVDIKAIQDRLQELTARHQKLFSEKARIMKIAERRAKAIMSLGLFGLVGHLGFVSIGTYYIWSWDIVEPLAYFITLSTSTVLATQYFKLKTDFENTTYFQYLSEKQFKKIASKYGFDVREYEAITEEINQLKNKLKYSLLIDL